MRLFRNQADGSFSLVDQQYVGDNIPPYAILSHTWGPDGDEVTFNDVSEGRGKGKKGYCKLEFCSKQATKDGLQHFWVDTACIDKSSSSELSEAINSMFSWYQNAAKCYVYLSDVSSTADCSAFHNSKWFTRGWTLQELLASKCVEFYSIEGHMLGDKISRAQEISTITGINTQALLREKAFSEFSVEERMSWISERKTTRAEDKAYSLLGIFNIFLSPIYGEGEKNAFRRLQREIDDSLAQRFNHQYTAREDQLRTIHQWLGPPDPSSNYHKALKQRQPGTGQWLLECEQYANWKENPASWLWLYGIPGCGKTILSSTILEDLLRCKDDPGKIITYFYFDFIDAQKQSAELMLRSLIYQLVRQSSLIPASLDFHYSAHEKGNRQLSLETLLLMTRQIIQEMPQVYVLIDALDECAQRAELMDLLETMADWGLQNMHVTLMSRRERYIETVLEGIVGPQDCICLESRMVDKDIQQYVRQRLSDDKALSKWGKDATLRREIEDALAKGSKGMFRWAVCQLDTLGTCRNRNMLRKSLASLPLTLDKTYERILAAIPGEESVYAIRALTWLAFSEWPLSLDEVAEAIAIDIRRNPAFDRDEVLEDPLDILNICSSLITIKRMRFDDWWWRADEDPGTYEEHELHDGLGLYIDTVVLAHYSVKEYLLSDRIQRGQAAQYGMQDSACHSAIAQACLGYLDRFQELWPENLNMAQEHSLALYARGYWTNHVRESGNYMNEVSQAALRFITAKLEGKRNEILNISDLPELPKSFWSPLYFAAFYGLEEVVKLLIEANFDVNEQSYTGDSNALQAASEKGHERIARILLEAGANVNARSRRRHKSALFIASLRGHERVVKLLLESGADVNAESGTFYCNALQAASAQGSVQVVRLLVNAGADVNKESGSGGNALQVASVHGNEQVVMALLEAGADDNG